MNLNSVGLHKTNSTRSTESSCTASHVKLHKTTTASALPCKSATDKNVKAQKESNHTRSTTIYHFHHLSLLLDSTLSQKQLSRTCFELQHGPHDAKADPAFLIDRSQTMPRQAQNHAMSTQAHYLYAFVNLCDSDHKHTICMPSSTCVTATTSTLFVSLRQLV